MRKDLNWKQTHKIFQWIERNCFCLVEDAAYLRDEEIPMRIYGNVTDIDDDSSDILLEMPNGMTISTLHVDDKSLKIFVDDHKISIKNDDIEMTYLICKIETVCQNVPTSLFA